MISLFGFFKLLFENRSGWLFISLIFDPLIVFLLLLNPALNSWEIPSWNYCYAPSEGFPYPGFEARCDKFASGVSVAILVGLIFQLMIM